MFFEKKERKHPITLNVTALIDVCAIIVIFLVMGTFFGESSIAIPSAMEIPKSFSKESLENAPRVVISEKDVTTSFMATPMPLKFFHDASAESPSPVPAAFDMYRAQLKAFVDAIPAQARGSGVLLNVIADGKTPYKDIFDVIAAFRSAGFQSMLFIAQGM